MTTKVLIEKVEEGAKYQDHVYDYWVTCRLSNNCKIVLFDYVPFDFTNVLSKSVEINIKTLFIENDIKENLRHFQGKIIEHSNRFYFTNDFINIEVSKEDIVNEKIELDVLNYFFFWKTRYRKHESIIFSSQKVSPKLIFQIL